MIDYKLTKQAAKDLKDLRKQYPDIGNKFLKLIGEVCEKGYDLPQTGKPEPLRENWSGYWSKRLTENDRIIYKIMKALDDDGKAYDYVAVVSCKGHYGNK